MDLEWQPLSPDHDFTKDEANTVVLSKISLSPANNSTENNNKQMCMFAVLQLMF